jgi:hypothetical protein
VRYCASDRGLRGVSVAANESSVGPGDDSGNASNRCFAGREHACDNWVGNRAGRWSEIGSFETDEGEGTYLMLAETDRINSARIEAILMTTAALASYGEEGPRKAGNAASGGARDFVRSEAVTQSGLIETEVIESRGGQASKAPLAGTGVRVCPGVGFGCEASQETTDFSGAESPRGLRAGSFQFCLQLPLSFWRSA